VHFQIIFTCKVSNPRKISRQILQLWTTY